MKRNYPSTIFLLTALALSPLSLSTRFTSERQLPANENSALHTPRSSLLFVPNHGQWPAAVRYQMRGLGGTWWFTEEAVWVTVVRGTGGTQGTEGTQSSGLRTQNPELCPLVPLSPCQLHGVNLKLTFPGLSPTAHWVASDEEPTKMNYFLGSDTYKWRSNLPTFAALHWQGLYPGVDLDFTDQGLIIGGLSSMLRMRVEGADGLRIDDANRLVAETAVGSIPLPLQPAALDGNTVSLRSQAIPNSP